MQIKKGTKIDSIAPYNVPTPNALFEGRSVKLLAAGNAEGHSPVLQFCDEKGAIGWAEESDFTIFDTNYLPVSNSALSEAARSLKH